MNMKWFKTCNISCQWDVFKTLSQFDFQILRWTSVQDDHTPPECSVLLLLLLLLFNFNFFFPFNLLLLSLSLSLSLLL